MVPRQYRSSAPGRSISPNQTGPCHHPQRPRAASSRGGPWIRNRISEGQLGDRDALVHRGEVLEGAARPRQGRPPTCGRLKHLALFSFGSRATKTTRTDLERRGRAGASRRGRRSPRGRARPRTSGTVPSGRWMQRTLTPSASRRRSPSSPSFAHSIRPTPSRPASSASSSRRRRLVAASRKPAASASIAAWISSSRSATRPGDLAERDLALLAGVAADQGHLAGGEVARADVDPHRHAFQLPVDGAAAEAGVDVGVDLDPGAGGGDRVAQLARRGERPVLVADDDDRHLDRGDPRRQAQPALVAVSHDQAADQPGRGAPGGRPGGLDLAALVGVGDVEGAGEVLAELVAGRQLQRFAVAGDPLAGHRVDRPGEALLGGLAAEQDRQRQGVDEEVAVDVEVDPQRVGGGVGGAGVDGVALLPEELAGAQEEARPQLPADHVRPLVEQQRQVAVGVDPLRHLLAEDRLAGRPHDDRLGQLLAAGDRHHRQLGAEALDVLGLALQVALRDQQREVDVLGAPAALIRRSRSAWIRSQIANP